MGRRAYLVACMSECEGEREAEGRLLRPTTLFRSHKLDVSRGLYWIVYMGSYRREVRWLGRMEGDVYLLE
jgi:hypothetical protein